MPVAPRRRPSRLSRARSTPSGSRPSGVELVEVRLERERGRRAQRRGSVVPHLVEQLGGASAGPASSASTSRRSRSSRCSRYSRSFACGSHTTGPCPGHSASSSQRLQAPQRIEVGGQRAAAGRDEHAALAEHRVAAEHDAARQQRDVVGGVARRRDHLERARAGHRPRSTTSGSRPGSDGSSNPSVARAAVRAATGAPERSRSSGTACEWSRWLWVSTMPAIPPALLRRLPHPLDVRRLRRAGIDHPRRRADQPRVRARERHRAGVRRAHQRDALRHSLCDRPPRGQYRATGRFWRVSDGHRRRELGRADRVLPGHLAAAAAAAVARRSARERVGAAAPATASCWSTPASTRRTRSPSWSARSR